jgi:hypothetical protein
MIEYHVRNKNKGPGQTRKAGMADLGTEQVKKYMEIATKYRLDDMQIGESAQEEQTIEQEYWSYTTAPLSLKNINILKFWEVNDLSMTF